jgi:hypothetical protein
MITKPLAIATSFLFSAAVLPAATNITLVQWGESVGDEKTGDEGIVMNITQSVTTDSDFVSGDVYTFVSGDVYSPAVGASYYPNASGRNPDFNVAGSVLAGTNNPWSIDVKQNTNGDTITFATTSGDFIDSIVIWEDFSPMTAVLDYTFSLNSKRSSGVEQAKYQLVMQDGAGNWYIQDNGKNWGANTSERHASDITWSDYTPYLNGADSGADSISASTISPTIAGAQAFGYRQELSYGANTFHDVSYFQVIAVVPEPSSAALLGLGGLVMALRRKRG